MNILILGASGQIGHHLHHYLSERLPQARVLGSARNFRLKDGSIETKLERIRFNPILDLWDGLGTFDVVINAIGQIRETKNSSFEQVHVELIQNFLAHRNKLGNPRFVQISALGAGVHEDLPFLASKSRGDHLLIANHKQSVILRPSIVASKGTVLSQRLNSLLQMSKASFGRIFVPKGFLDTRVQPVLVEELAEIIGNIIAEDQFDGRTIPIVGSKQFSFRELLEIGAAKQRLKVKFIEIPKPILAPSVKYFVAPMFPGILTYTQFQLLFRDNIADAKDTISLLGREPKDTVEFWEKEFTH